VDLGTGRTAVAIGVGSYHSCALLDDATVKCWGVNSYGELGLGSTENRGDGPDEMGDLLLRVELGTGRTVTAIGANGAHTCALLDDATLKCWGFNGFGQLGVGDRAIRGDEPDEMGDHLPAVELGTGRTVTAIGVGELHTCALLDDAGVKCWGGNGRGQLGIGDDFDRGVFPWDMGDDLPAVDLGTGRTAVSVTAGGVHTCALLDDSTLKCWGMNLYGQLGLGDAVDRGAAATDMGDNLLPVDLGPDRWATAASAGRGAAATDMGDNQLPVDLGPDRRATAASAGILHTCATLDDGRVKCWGYNAEGELGLGDKLSRGDQADEMGAFLPPVDLSFG
jgi:alpha-tubulin suppressor-like RCC1 family protein